jgi:FAD/FMN-containing dehydrogenase
MSTTPDWDELGAAIAGEVILPRSHGYDVAYQALNARFDEVRPQAVVRSGTSEDVVEAIRFAVDRGMAVAPRGGGHCFGGRSSTEGLLLDVSPMSSVEVAGDTVTVGGGTRLGDVYRSLLEHGLAIPGGSCPSVGVAGLTLGGGLGIIGRKHGLTSDHLLGVKIVLADGRMLECDEDHEPDLFWALRGGGAGNFGVVTQLAFRTVPAPDATNFEFTWPFSEAAAAIDAWQSWAPSAPDELAASLVISAGAEVEVPPSVEVFGVMIGPEPEAGARLDDLVARVGSDPSSSSSTHLSFRETIGYWGDRASRDPVAGEPPGRELRGCRFIKSEFFQRPLPTEVIEELLENLRKDRVPGQSRELDFSPWGGAYTRVPADATAFVHRDDRYWLKHAAEVDPAASREEKEAAHDWARRSWGLVHPLGTGRVFPNFPDPDLEDWPQAYFGANLVRLRGVKARYDPGNVFRFRQSLSPS